MITSMIISMITSMITSISTRNSFFNCLLNFIWHHCICFSFWLKIEKVHFFINFSFSEDNSLSCWTIFYSNNRKVSKSLFFISVFFLSILFLFVADWLLTFARITVSFAFSHSHSHCKNIGNFFLLVLFCLFIAFRWRFFYTSVKLFFSFCFCFKKFFHNFSHLLCNFILKGKKDRMNEIKKERKKERKKIWKKERMKEREKESMKEIKKPYFLMTFHG